MQLIHFGGWGRMYTYVVILYYNFNKIFYFFIFLVSQFYEFLYVFFLEISSFFRPKAGPPLQIFMFQLFQSLVYNTIDISGGVP